MIQHVHLQLLQSDLCDSAVRQTGFPAGLQVQGGMKKGVIGTRASGGAILVQVVGIMEVGNSAFTLGNVRQARLDKADMTGLTRDNEEPGEGAGEEGARIRGNGGADDDEDATMPPYPRSMLSLLLSDGTATIKAMETRRIGGLVLGETPLGCKVNTRESNRSIFAHGYYVTTSSYLKVFPLGMELRCWNQTTSRS